MKKLVAAVCMISMGVASHASLASENQGSLGVVYHMGTYSETGIPDANLSALGIRFGKQFSENASFEAHLGIGMADDTVYVSGFDVDVELDNVISLFIKGDIPLSSAAKVYGLLGFTKGEITATAMGFSFSESDSGLSYGLGAEAEIGNDLSIVGDYIFYLDESEYDYAGFNIGFKKRF